MSNTASIRPLVDLVVLTDTSPTMKEDARAVSRAIEAALGAVENQCPADLKVVWLGIEGRWRQTAFECTLRQYLTQQCGVAETELRSRQRGELPSAGAQEDAARAIEDVANYFDWRENARRNLFYLGDEALDAGGDKTESGDIAAANRAIQAAQGAQVRVHTHCGTSKSQHRDSIVTEYARVAKETGGECFVAVEDAPTDFTEALTTIICGCQTEIPSSERLIMAKKTTTQKTESNAEPKPPTATSETKTSYVPTTMTGLQDYAYWWAYAREHAKTVKANAKAFRRGRIWS